MQKIRKQCYAIFILSILFAAAFLLSGCGDSSGSSEQDDGLHYHITERIVSDPVDLFASAQENQDKELFLTPVDSFVSGEKLYCLYSSTGMEDRIPIFFDYYLYVLEPPYEQWACYAIPSDSSWSSDNYYYIQGIAGVSENGVYFFMAYDRYHKDGSIDPVRQMGFYGWDGSTEILEKLPVDDVAGDLTVYSVDEKLYAVSKSGFTVYDEQLQPVRTQNLENRISGCFSYDSETFWFGFDKDGNLSVWDKPGGERLFSLGSMVNAYSDFRLVRASTGKFILANNSSIWTGEGDTPLNKILSFAKEGYNLEEILILIPKEDGKLCLLVSFEGEYYMLTIEQTDVAGKQEITLVSDYAVQLKNVTAAFNRQSDRYYISLVDSSEVSDRNDYLQNLQMEIAAGRGPDLVSPGVIDLEGCLENGYLEPLDDIVENPADYWSAALESGVHDGFTYGIPYRVYLSFLITSKSLAGDLESWDLEQMMEAVRNSPAEALEMNKTGMNIVLKYGVLTLNPKFIDYEAGKSHLTEKPFLDFLEFAKLYGDDLYYSEPERMSHDEAGDYYRDGKLAVYCLYLNTPSDLLLAPAFFQGREALIGNPQEGGRGISMYTDLLCLNVNSPCKEGAKEFLRYLISAEGQQRFVQNYSPLDDHSTFSSRRDVTEMVLDAYQISTTSRAMSDVVNICGITYDEAPLSEEQIAQFWALFEDAKPEFSWPSEIYDMACEELVPYFAGDCTAEDAAAKLENRVQLYLDENK